MRRPLWLRCLIACWSLWFCAALSEPAALSACPAHSAHAAAGHMAHMSHAGMQSHHTDEHSDQQPSHHCSCLGACCCTPSVAPPAPNYAVIPAAVVARSVVRPMSESAPATTAPHTLPFANGPPTTRAL